ncbi:MAG: CBS domain-containing protein [Xenococcaceae cyanobacterium MO_188.B32]|nr:CBS domain-containing protein [Xenococcaceae cyanobacterium MO_188.B32]
MQPNNFFYLDQVIDRQPLTVVPDTSLNDVIRQMQEWGNSCHFTENDNDITAGITTNINNSCALIVEQDKLQGVFTERDLVRLIAAGRDLTKIAVSEVMSRELITLTSTGIEDVFTAINLMRQHRIRHLPVIDESDRLLGLITEKDLRQNLQPINLMKWRRVEEIMETKVIHAQPSISVRQAAQLMANHQVSYVAIVEQDNNNELLIPVGIITERDIVQFQTLNLDLTQPVQKLMSTPLFLVSPEDSLWSVHQQMQQRRVRRLVVGGARGELQGIITQTSLLQVFDPTEMYGIIEQLQHQVCQLEIERAEYFQERTTELEEHIKERTLELTEANQQLQQEIEERQEALRHRQQAESQLLIEARQQGAIAELGQYALIEKNLVLLLERAVHLVASVLEVEYCSVLELLPEGKNLLLKAGVGWHDGLVGIATVKADSDSQAGYTLLSSEPVIVTDLLSETRFSGTNLLLDHQVVSSMSVVISGNDKPFGILGTHTTRQRIFSQDDVNFLCAIANILAQAIDRQQAELALRESEQKFRAIFNQTFQFIGLLEPNGNVIEANQTALDFVGLTPADVVGKPFWETPWWTMSVEIQQRLKKAIERSATGEFVRFEVDHLGTDNRLVTVDFSLTPVKDKTGKVVMLIPEGRNISDRKQIEADLQKSNRILQAISWIQTKFLADAEPEILFEGMLDRFLALTESEYGFIGEILFAADGSPTMEESYMKVRGRPYLKTHAITNIAWNEETRAFYAENAPKGMEFHNLQTLFGAVIVTGKPVIANSPSTDPRRGGLPDGHPPLNAFLGLPFYKENEMTGMVGIANREGGYDEAIVDYLQPFLATCSRIIEAYRSDRQKQQAEQTIIEQAALLDVATDAIMVRDLNNQILFWNQGAENLYGWTTEEALNQDANELLYREPLTKLTEIQQAVREKGKWQGELNQITRVNKDIVVQSRWTLVKDKQENPQSYLVVNTDISEKKQLEAQFLRTQRLESLGTLAGGIAHDLNNILAPILGFAQLLPHKITNVDKQTLRLFKIIETNAKRGTALVNQILTFSRGLESDRGSIQIRHLLAEIRQIIKETFPKTIELEMDLSSNLWTVEADATQIHQVLMNLAVNARDAMRNGGTLSIIAENFPIDANFARLHIEAHEGPYVLITFADTGVGIPPVILDRIFEPFFTTKEVGRGTGLGLSTAIGIIKSHGGFIDVYSEVERGTEFRVFLPACETAEVLPTEEELPQGNRELILVVDDETQICEVTKATLETFNYRVLTANNGIDAIAVYAQHQHKIEVVLTDIMMPSMNGKTLIRTIKKINPHVKIIVFSGLISNREIIAELDNSIAAFINKPYTTEALLKTLHDAIDS